MYKTKNDLSLEVREKICALCNAQLANCIDLQTQTKQAHWNVKGPEFIGLHLLFDKIFKDVVTWVDLIAERGVMMGGIANGTVREVAKATKLKEYPHDIAGCHDHVIALSSVLGQFGAGVREAIDAADGLEDADTADMFTQISRCNDKWLWFVEAHLQAPN